MRPAGLNVPTPTGAGTRQKRKRATGGGNLGGAGGGEDDPDRALWICNRGAAKYKRRKGGNMGREEDGDNVEEIVLRWAVADQPFITDDPKALSLLQKLAQGFESNLDSPQCRSWVNALSSIMSGVRWHDEDSAIDTDSLAAIIKRCQRSQAVLGAATFAAMVDLVQLVIKVDRYAVAHHVKRASYLIHVLAP